MLLTIIKVKKFFWIRAATDKKNVLRIEKVIKEKVINFMLNGKMMTIHSIISCRKWIYLKYPGKIFRKFFHTHTNSKKSNFFYVFDVSIFHGQI